MKIVKNLGYSKQSAWFQLTALWAFVEVTLGGLLHAIRLPLTGLVVGGSAVAILCVMALMSENVWKDIIRATGVVLVVKAGASPHSPIPAYLAVSFQGFAAALIFSIVRNYKIASILFSIIAMMESALQKLLTLVVMYGESLKDALDIFLGTVAKELGLNSMNSLSGLSGTAWLAIIYVSIYIIWGAVLGWRMSGFPDRLSSLLEIIRFKRKEYKEPNSMYRNPLTSNKYVFWFVYLIVLIAMVLILGLVEDSKYNITYVLIRSISATLMLFLIINPLFNYFVKRGAKKHKNVQLVNDITQDFMQFRMDYKFSLYCVEKEISALMKYIRAMEFMIAIRLQSQEPKTENTHNQKSENTHSQELD
jgi:hypothetical protein